MQIPEKSWVEYINRLARLNEEAGRKMADYIAKHGTRDADALIAYAQALVQKYGEGCAELACQMYDAVAEASEVDVPPAEPAPPADYEETAKMVNATKQSPPLLQSGVSRLVKRAGSDTTLKNAIRDGAEWAWVPNGDTCPFCITLASRGWQKASKKALKGDHAEHIHANCDCEYAIRFDSRTTVAGYDPDKYLAQYYDHGGDVNAMRRAQYAKNKDTINAQKRAAYAARRLREKKARGILKDNQNRYLTVTEESVERVTAFRCQLLDEIGQENLSQAHKNLLKEAMGHDTGVEVAQCLRVDMQLIGGTIVGDERASVKIPDYSIPYIAMHTHPSGLTFSPNDIAAFAKRKNMRMLTAVGNNGVVYALERGSDCDEYAILDLSTRLNSRIFESRTKKEVIEALNEFFEEARKYGVQYYTTEN